MTDYATEDVLVSADWVDDHLDQFRSDDPDYRLLEVDVDTEVYDVDLEQPVVRVVAPELVEVVLDPVR